jgi:hypothetical protein
VAVRARMKTSFSMSGRITLSGGIGLGGVAYDEGLRRRLRMKGKWVLRLP